MSSVERPGTQHPSSTSTASNPSSQLLALPSREPMAWAQFNPRLHPVSTPSPKAPLHPRPNQALQAVLPLAQGQGPSEHPPRPLP